MNNNSNYERLVAVAAKAKDALLAGWDTSGCFTDKGIVLDDEGFLSDTVGLTSLLLMLVAFRSEGRIISDSDRQRIAAAAEATFAKLSDWSKSTGFIASPWLDGEDSAAFFTPERGYMDTISWVTSAAILARYAERNGIITFSQTSTSEAIFQLIAKGISQLLQGQREDGTWGFMADSGSSKSLYFTYAAGATLGDFYDYVLGEIEDVEQDNDASESMDFLDEDLLEYLDGQLGMNTRAAVDTAREKLSMWLLQDCLPLLPKLACCRTRPSFAKQLGLWDHDRSNPFEKQGIDYYNLYYTYYLLDLMVLMSTDQRYADMRGSQDSAAFDALREHYRTAMVAQDEGAEPCRLMSEQDYSYYFDANGDPSQFWTDCMEQAIHSTRAQYMDASRTGADFWDSQSSEIPISWLHDDPAVQSKVKAALSRSKTTLTDPAVGPMALRVNASYCYYICNQTDIAVDRLFNTICDDASPETRRKCVEGLWDQVDYSLMVTERSIEALVDYYDYLCRFELSADQPEASVPAAVSAPAPARSELDELLDRRIGQYLCSEQGAAAIRQALGGAAPAAAAGPAQELTAEQLVRAAELVRDLAEDTSHLPDPKGDEDARLVYTLVTTLEALDKCLLKTRISGTIRPTEGETPTGYAGRINDASDAFMRRYRSLLERLFEDLGKTGGDLKSLYEKLVALGPSR